MKEEYSGRNNRELLIAISSAALFMLIGVAIVYAGIYVYNDIQSVRKNGTKTEGVILRYERRGTETINMKNMFVVPIIRFQTQKGKTVIAEGKADNTSVLQNICASGKRVEVIYDPLNPNNAVINTFAELWFVPLLAWIIGAGFILVPPFTIWRYYNGRKQG